MASLTELAPDGEYEMKKFLFAGIESDAPLICNGFGGMFDETATTSFAAKGPQPRP